MRRKKADKPEKPYPEFPLFPHDSGQWAKRVAGKIRYYGVWADHNAALAKYRESVPYHHAGLETPPNCPTVADLLDLYLGRKDQARKAGEIVDDSYTEYEATCDVIAESLGKDRPLNTITTNALVSLRTALGEGKPRKLAGGKTKPAKKLSPVTLKRRLTIARMVFKHAKKLGETIDYDDELKSPPSIQLRKARSEKGERLYDAAEIRQLVEAADPHLKAMILLGINAAFGPKDCYTLPTSAVDLEGGWHKYSRAKTHVERRCPLWPETVEAIKAVAGDPRIFNGRYWDRHVVLKQFLALCKAEKIKYVGFYSLRRTFETIATTAEVPQAIIDFIMGHIAPTKDMSAVYRQKLFNSQLRKCTDHVRQWYLGAVTLE